MYSSFYIVKSKSIKIPLKKFEDVHFNVNCLDYKSEIVEYRAISKKYMSVANIMELTVYMLFTFPLFVFKEEMAEGQKGNHSDAKCCDQQKPQADNFNNQKTKASAPKAQRPWAVFFI